MLEAKLLVGIIIPLPPKRPRARRQIYGTRMLSKLKIKTTTMTLSTETTVKTNAGPISITITPKTTLIDSIPENTPSSLVLRALL